MTHDQLQEDLACHLRAGTDRMVWTDTQLGPVGSPRPDVFTVNKSFSRFRTDAYEIKVSVSDLRSDVTSGKWQSYRKFSNAVWFAFPRGLVPLEMIPKECGVILRSDTCWRAARKPVAQVLDTLPRDAWLKLLMDLHPVNAFGQVKPPRHANEYMAADIVAKKLGKELGQLFSDVKRAESTLSIRKIMLETDLKKIGEERDAQQAQARAAINRSNDFITQSMLDLGVVLGLQRSEIDAQTLGAAISGFRHRLAGRGLQNAIDLLVGLKAEMIEAA